MFTFVSPARNPPDADPSPLPVTWTLIRARIVAMWRSLCAAQRSPIVGGLRLRVTQSAVRERPRCTRRRVARSRSCLTVRGGRRWSSATRVAEVEQVVATSIRRRSRTLRIRTRVRSRRYRRRRANAASYALIPGGAGNDVSGETRVFAANDGPARTVDLDGARAVRVGGAARLEKEEPDPEMKASRANAEPHEGNIVQNNRRAA
jgi:hypothetical protein